MSLVHCRSLVPDAPHRVRLLQRPLLMTVPRDPEASVRHQRSVTCGGFLSDIASCLQKRTAIRRRSYTIIAVLPCGARSPPHELLIYWTNVSHRSISERIGSSHAPLTAGVRWRECAVGRDSLERIWINVDDVIARTVRLSFKGGSFFMILLVYRYPTKGVYTQEHIQHGVWLINASHLKLGFFVRARSNPWSL